MARRLLLISLVALTSIFIYGYWNDISVGKRQQPTLEIMENYSSSNMLDGLTFVGELGPEGKPKDVSDVFVFDVGTFVSKECELRCDYPARPYFVSETEKGTEFISNTKCPYKDAEITWRGTVKDGKIYGMATWTVRRWYWTVTNNFEFAGRLEEQPGNVASTN